MKLASLKGGRDGRLVVVSDDLAWCCDTRPVVSTLQEALDDWDRYGPQLEALAESLADSDPATEHLESQNKAAAPLRAVAIANAMRRIV